jgi:hypothetical protein
MKKLLLSLLILLPALAWGQTAQTVLSNAIAAGYGKLSPYDLATVDTYGVLVPVGAGTANAALSNAVANGYGALAPTDLQMVTAYGAAQGVGSGTGTTYTNASTAAGLIIGSSIGTNVTLAQLPAGVVTNGFLFTPNGTLTNQYQILFADIPWFDMTVTLWTNSAGCVVYTNTATNGLKVFMAYDDPAWTSSVGAPVWSITTNFPDTLLNAPFVNLANSNSASPLGVGIWALYFTADDYPSTLQVYALNQSINNLAFQSSFIVAGDLIVTNTILAQEVEMEDGDGLKGGYLYIGPNGPTLQLYSPVPLVGSPNGFEDIGNMFFGNIISGRILGWEMEGYTNTDGTISGWFENSCACSLDWKPRCGGYPAWFNVPLNGFGQSLFGILSNNKYPVDSNPYVIPPAMVDIYVPLGGYTNTAALWMQPAAKSPNPTAGIIENDGTNFYVGKTNANGLFAVSPLTTKDDLTNGTSTFSGGFLVLSNAFNLNLITNGMPNFSSMICSSNGPIVVVTRSNNIGYVNYLNTPTSMIP